MFGWKTPCLLLLTAVPFPQPSHATEIVRITADNYYEVVPEGKEVDAIVGDWVLRNQSVSLVVAHPTPGRQANMTVRGVGGMIIDLTSRFYGSDQLSCFYPGGGRYLFEDESHLKIQQDADGTVTVRLEGEPVAKDGTTATVEYRLADKQEWLEYQFTITCGDSERELRIEDAVRCDGNLFVTGNLENGLWYANDSYFGQCYGVLLDGHEVEKSGGRNMVLRSAQDKLHSLMPGESLTWSGKLFCSQGLPGIRSLCMAAAEQTSIQPVRVQSKTSMGPIAHARVSFSTPEKDWGTIQSDQDGNVRTKLPSGTYLVSVSAIGHKPRELRLEVADAPRSEILSFESPSRVRAKITDGQGRPIAAKVQFIGLKDSVSPDFGPDSAISAIKNVVYTANGRFEQPIDAGTYRVLVSHGPEYDADTQELTVSPGQLVQLESTLPRVVDTHGWVSSDFHSHSTPSGDNVSHQTGRVLNLLAEHIEFAPCTEHNRVDTYADDLALLQAEDAMATCTGMELTGGPLPINHQNAFPLERHVHTQDGGGPKTDADPVKQIERLALWDNASEKVVQSNHPNIPSMLGDRDLDGSPDQGFRGMLGWMDVIEVHPPEGIFTPDTESTTPDDKRKNPIFHWMRLLNLGYRITGVVNTDAHYNFHGSGWLRNYLKSSADEPSRIALAEMIHSAEDGHLIMTTGPFLQVELRSQSTDGKAIYVVGDDVPPRITEATLWIRVQCPNWFDVNRVQVFANGRPLDRMNFTRRDTPQLFRDSNVRFEAELKLPAFDEDTHLIVATIGEGLKLGPVMGDQRGELPPVAVSNPIFIDVDGSGFQGNGDDLGVPFMLPETLK